MNRLVHYFAMLIAGTCAVLNMLAAEPAEAETSVPGRVLHVSTRGDDKNDGLSGDMTLRTISRAAALVEPGDLVLVAGGTYFEHVKLAKAGTAERPIIFRAAPGHTPVVTFARTRPGWRKVGGSRFTYAVSACPLPNLVWEDRTVTRYVRLEDPLNVEKTPGSYLYDAANKLLKVHPLRGDSPETAAVMVVQHSEYSLKRTTGRLLRGLTGFFSRTVRLWDRGFELVAPYNRVEGFTVAYQPVGIQIKANHCEALDNTVYGCVAGIHVLTGDKVTVRSNTCFRNDSHGIIIQKDGDALVEGNMCRDNTPAGTFRGHPNGGLGIPHDLAFYGGAKTGHKSFVANTVISRHPGHVWRIKGLNTSVTVTRNVFVGGPPKGHFPRGGSSYASNTVVGAAIIDRHGNGWPQITPEMSNGNRIVQKNLHLYSKEIIEAGAGWYVAAREFEPDRAHFADPARHDYRLIVGSPHLGQGAFPEPAPVRYVSPDGDDRAAGTSPGAAWKTIAKAIGSASAGDTVYVMPGVYRETVTLSLRGIPGKQIAIRSYARGRSVLEGEGRAAHGMVFHDAASVTIDGLTFTGFRLSAVKIQGGRHIRLLNNVFDGGEASVQAEGARSVTLENNTLRACTSGVRARGVDGRLVLRNNLFVDVRGAPIVLDEKTRTHLVSERNGFNGATSPEWLSRWRSRTAEGHPSMAVEAAVSPPDYLLPRGSPLACAGLNHKPLGARPGSPDKGGVVIEHFRAAALFPHRALLAWDTPFDYAQGDLVHRGENGNALRVRIRQDKALSRTGFVVPLQNLLRGETYAATLHLETPDGRKGSATTSFRTPEAVRPPATLFVTVDGNDGNDGRDPARPFRTLSAASLATVPGDTVLVGPGVYREALRIMCSGISSARPLTFRSARPGEAIIDCQRMRPFGVEANDVKHVVVDGFQIRNIIYASGHAILANRAEDLVIANSTLGNPEDQRSGELVRLFQSRDITITNSLFSTGWFNVRAMSCDNITVEHNTFFHGGIGGLMLEGGKDSLWHIRNNIFFGRMHEAKDTAAVVVSPSSKPVACNHNLYWQFPRNPKKPKRNGPALFAVGGYKGKKDNARTIQEIIAKYDVEHHGKYANPRFENWRKGDFRLKPDSPAIGMGEGGSTVGMDGAAAD